MSSALSIQSLCSEPPRPGSPTSTIVSTPPTTYQDDEMSMSYSSGLSIDDPDVRIAAEALGDLRAGDCRSPTSIDDNYHPPDFLNRVSTYPIVSTAVKAYENGKSQSRGFRYGAGMLESVARPVVRSFEPLDGFACRQLDKIERRYTTSHEDLERGHLGKRKFRDEKREDGYLQKPNGIRSQSSPWQTVASGLRFSMSEESLKSLRYCIQWLQWANDHLSSMLNTINAHIPKRGPGDPAISGEEEAWLSTKACELKREIVGTLKSAVDIVSKYAGSALPEPARTKVRGYVLGLPSRWAAKQIETPANRQSGLEEVSRVSSLAKESLDMLSGISSIVSMTLSKGDEWAEHRMSGFEHNHIHSAGTTESN